MKFLPCVAVALHCEEEEPIEYRYLMDHASFRHTDAAEFFLYVGGDDRENYQSYLDKLDEMTVLNCSKKFIDSFEQAWELGVVWIQFYYE